MPKENNLYQRLGNELHYLVEDIQMRVIVTLMVIDQVKMEDTLEDKDITRKEVEDCQIERIIKVEGIQEVEDPLMVEDP